MRSDAHAHGALLSRIARLEAEKQALATALATARDEATARVQRHALESFRPRRGPLAVGAWLAVLVVTLASCARMTGGPDPAAGTIKCQL